MYGQDSVRYRAAPLDALSGTRKTKYVVPTPVSSFTQTTTGAQQVMRFEFSDPGLLDPSTAYIACTFSMAITGGPVADASSVAIANTATSGGIVCPKSIESLFSIVETQVMGQQVDYITNYSQLQSMYNALYGPGYARTFGKVMGITQGKDERMIGFTTDATATNRLQNGTGWQNRELLIPMSGTSLFGNPKSGLLPMRFMTANGNPLRLNITLANPLDCFGVIQPVDANGVPKADVLTSLEYTLSNVRLYYDALDIDSTVEKWQARISAGIPLPYPLKRVFNVSRTINVGEQQFSYSFPANGNDIRAVVFAFQAGARRPADLAAMSLNRGIVYNDESVFPDHSSAYGNPGAAFNYRTGAPPTAGSSAPRLAGLSQAQLYVNQVPYPAFGPFQIGSQTLIPSATMPYLEMAKICGVIGEMEAVGMDVDYRSYVDSDYCVSRRFPRGTGFNQQSNTTFPDPIGTPTETIKGSNLDVGEVKLTTDSPMFYLGFNLSSDPSNEDDLAGLGPEPTQNSKQMLLNLQFTEPIQAYDATTNPFGGPITVQAYIFRRSTMLLYASSAVVTDQIVATSSE